MALTRKQIKRKTARTRRKPVRPAPDTRDVIERIDAMIRELQAMRRELATSPKTEPESNIVGELFGAAGKGTWDEYDMNLDWMRFSDWQLR